jgi:hypothetical protein
MCVVALHTSVNVFGLLIFVIFVFFWVFGAIWGKLGQYENGGDHNGLCFAVGVLFECKNRVTSP